MNIVRIIIVTAILVLLAYKTNYKVNGVVVYKGDKVSSNVIYNSNQKSIIVQHYFNIKVSSIGTKSIIYKASLIGVPKDYKPDGSWVSYASADVLESLRKASIPDIGDSVVVSTTLIEQIGYVLCFLLALIITICLDTFLIRTKP